MARGLGIQAGRVCPQCGQEDSVPLVWGLPDFGTIQLAERGLVRLGGCMVGEEIPAFGCRGCGLEWGSDDDPTAEEQELVTLLGVEFPDVVRALGTGWRRDTMGFPDGDVAWFVSGEPAQLAVGVDALRLLLAAPLTVWGYRREADAGRVFHRDDLLYLPEVVAEAAESIASRRRRSFRWCRRCRCVQAPESYVGAARMCEPCAWAEGMHPDAA